MRNRKGRTGTKELLSEKLEEEIEVGRGLYVLDVRSEDNFEKWKIEGNPKTEVVNIPYYDFLEDEEGSVGKLPKGEEITIVCAGDGSSNYVGDILEKRGFDFRILQKGMKGWSRLLTTSTFELVIKEKKATILQVNRIAKGCLSYIIGSSGSALVIDPSIHVSKYKELAGERGWDISHIIDTHLHADHVSGGRRLARMTGAPYYITPIDAESASYEYTPVEDGDEIRVGSMTVNAKALHTPGHTAGINSILVEGRVLFTGDTLFLESVGRPDLAGKAREWANLQYDTLFKKILKLGDGIYVFPSHYANRSEMGDNRIVSATLGEIKERNKFLKLKDRDTFVDQLLKDTTPMPPNYEEIIGINLGRKRAGEEKVLEYELGPNHCAVSGKV